ncbi:bifunctional acetyl-CoA hydrolase/transferase family protein/GNAT family N-acetyltransferase [Desulforhopalus singaporensis]|uniref:Acyl-CoA hydrolase n=1 Tax=Desulforhopalus singaporensis TaxID=91360 RepID=A0A1H0T7Z8_9BACT|nr:bifunctional acetyl-CoA hydrolase/transferase family protein/GNAT family N-acetyltransferase [Desulforhopalus singaporensis]SDP49728.1 Acyl-CoA hydrolase [Desulforhopalus singaporensis]
MATTLPEKKIVSAEEAIATIRKGNRVFIGSGCGEPQHLIHTMANSKTLEDVIIFQMLAHTLADYLSSESFLKRFSVKLFFVPIRMQQAAFEGKIDYIPTYLSQLPQLFRNNQIVIDTVLIQISPPDEFGIASLGVSVDVTLEAVKSAKTVIAQVNPLMPRTHGDGFIHVDDIDYLVVYREELIFLEQQQVQQETSRRIAQYVKELVEDGSTLHVGYGNLPYSLLSYFADKNDLGIHTHMISDGFIPLMKSGNINNKRKNFMTGRAVATFCMGSRIAYDYIDNNIQFYFGTADWVNTPGIIGKNDNLVSISSALEVDLTGQVCSDSVGRQLFSGTGDQVNYIRGATLSRGGVSIIALPSTSQDGRNSKIVANLSPGAGIATLRSDVNFVVTEFGIAQLKGKSISQRVIELSEIAHPDFREELIEEAKRNHFIFPDQLPPRAEDLIFIEEYKSRLYLKNGKTMLVRPLLPSDEIGYRNFFYSLDQETVYMRFFYPVTTFSHEMAQDHWSTLDYRNNLTLIGLVQDKGNKEIVTIATYAALDEEWAEVAFVVREDFHHMGIGLYLLQELEKIARKNGFKGFYATTLSSNQAMIGMARKRYPQAKVEQNDDEVVIHMKFT